MEIVLENAALHLEKYKLMMTPNHMHLITREVSNHFALGVSAGGAAIGYVLVRTRAEISRANIIELKIEQKFAGNGHEKILLHTVENKLREKNYHTLTFDCVFHEGETATKEFLQPGEGWSDGELLSHIWIADLQGISRDEWIKKKRIPKGFELFSWDELSVSEGQDIEAGCEQWYPEKLSPLQEEQQMNATLSVGLRYGGNVIGWMIVQRAARNMVFFKTQFIRDEFRKLGRGMLLIAEAIRRTSKIEGMAYGMFVMDKDNADMVRLANKHFAPYVIRRKMFYSFQKALV
ncbi:hypothetical protein J31TS6_15840 [Brevibacillus reuszeri]|uniref:hypothetical protein n=1 Tax=Brevibacillus reuszeri TaxID=54915 RepID=UPI001B286879|nr:hypothetical protein [Brevibacillus reuszeri]GIO05556.1 hypothetical protein J31TS6_15840 [Brevibacillus reuszeri]